MRTGEQCMTEDIMEIDIGRIRPYEKNPRNNGKSVDKVAGSIREFGFLQPIVCDGDGVILAGHTRYAAAKKLGLAKVPVLFAHGLTPEQARAYRLADNKVGEGSEWDEEMLIGELDALKGADMGLLMTGLGFDTSAEYRRRKSWKVSEKKCGLVSRIMLRTKCGYMYTSFFNTGKGGKSLEEIKGDDTNIGPFADNLCDYLSKVLGDELKKGGWCICTTPRRRHRTGTHFATEVCRKAALELGIPFCEDAVTARTRGRLEPEFELVKDPEMPNVILYDDIITTGITMRETRRLLMEKGHNVLVIAAVRNQ